MQKNGENRSHISSSTTSKENRNNKNNDNNSEPDATSERVQLAFDVPSGYWELLSDDEGSQFSAPETS
ncbi:unnamed protein product [Trichobilharzia szidati]|nr:unnamed protein product [Trichobilharzia szidati]CAH8869505.1 unnamed protein product [Trichobilharzia szidati]